MGGGIFPASRTNGDELQPMLGRSVPGGRAAMHGSNDGSNRHGGSRLNQRCVNDAYLSAPTGIPRVFVEHRYLAASGAGL